MPTDRERFEACWKPSPVVDQLANEYLKCVAWRYWQAAVADERERAADVAESLCEDGQQGWEIAAAIRKGE